MVMPRRRPRGPGSSKPKKFQDPGVVFQPRTHQGIQQGINKLANVIRPTLGPLPRFVANEPVTSSKLPEMLDSGGTIARRIIQLPNREEDMGAMFLRHVLWRMQEKAGDGTATTAVILQSIFNQGLKYISAGGNAMLLRGYLEKGSQIILDELKKMTIPIQGKEKLTKLAESISYDPELSKYLGEIYDIIGEFGRLEIRSGNTREIDREYVEGMYWDTGYVSREMVNIPGENKASLEDPAILISDLEIQDPQDLIPLLDMSINAGYKSLFMIVNEISDRAISIVLSKSNREKIQVVAAKSPYSTITARLAALDDLAILTGGVSLTKTTGDHITGVKLVHLGKARRAWANQHNFGIVGGKGDPRKLRQHIAALRTAFNATDDPDTRKQLRERISKLIGGSATLWIGGGSPNDITARKELAERASEAMRGAMRDGVVPGGGVALLRCRRALLAASRKSTNEVEKVAFQIISRALEEPIRTILTNGGFDDSAIISRIEKAGAGFGFDVRDQRIVNMIDAGIYDAASVIKSATFSAIHGAAMILTTDVLIHRKNPPESFTTE